MMILTSIVLQKISRIFRRESGVMVYFEKTLIGNLREIPENFCHKDRETTEQAVFFCLVCNCDLKSLKPLRDHVTGNKHIRKACDFKRKIMGIPNQVKLAQPKTLNLLLTLHTAAPERAQGEEHQEVKAKSGHWSEP